MPIVEPGAEVTVDGITSRPDYAYSPPKAFFDAPTGQPPSGPDVYNVLDYGAKADPTFNNRDAIQNAIDAAHDAGGGLIYIPPGTYGITGDPGDPSQGGVRSRTGDIKRQTASRCVNANVRKPDLPLCNRLPL